MDIAYLTVLLLQRSVHFVLPFVVCLNFILLLRLLAPTFGLVDKPNIRKSHSGNIPLVGGPAIFFALAISASLLVPQFQVLVFLVLCLCLVVLGMADDILDLPAILRIIVQAAVAVAMAVYGHLYIENIGNIFGYGDITITGTVAVVFTMVCTIGSINAINMIDGIDGLAGSILSISFAALALIAWQGDDWVSAAVLTILVGSISAFLMFNSRLFYKHAQLFMGDSGSMLLGFVLVWFLIELSQGENTPMSPVVAGWIFGLPLMDTISVMVRRLRNGVSVLTADRDHFHHNLLDAGFSVNQTVIICSVFHLFFVVIGMIANNWPTLEPFLFWAFVLSVLGHHFFSPKIILEQSKKIAVTQRQKVANK